MKILQLQARYIDRLDSGNRVHKHAGCINGILTVLSDATKLPETQIKIIAYYIIGTQEHNVVSLPSCFRFYLNV